MHTCSRCQLALSHKLTHTAQIGVVLVDLCPGCYSTWLWRRYVDPVALLQAEFAHRSRP